MEDGQKTANAKIEFSFHLLNKEFPFKNFVKEMIFTHQCWLEEKLAVAFILDLSKIYFLFLVFAYMCLVFAFISFSFQVAVYFTWTGVVVVTSITVI